MTTAWRLLAIIGLVAPSPAAAEPAAPDRRTFVEPLAGNRDGPIRLSLPTDDDRIAWTHSGFRLGLEIQYGLASGTGARPTGALLGVAIRPGVRLDRAWSIYVPLHYATLGAGGRFAAALEPTWHITPNLAVGLGAGYAGLLSVQSGRTMFDPAYDGITQPYTFPDAAVPLFECTGVGISATGRIELGYVLGPRSRTQVALEVLGQWTGCEYGIGVVDPYTGVEDVHRQFWGHLGGALTWGIEWR